MQFMTLWVHRQRDPPCQRPDMGSGCVAYKYLLEFLRARRSLSTQMLLQTLHWSGSENRQARVPASKCKKEKQKKVCANARLNMLSFRLEVLHELLDALFPYARLLLALRSVLSILHRLLLLAQDWSPIGIDNTRPCAFLLRLVCHLQRRLHITSKVDGPDYGDEPVAAENRAEHTAKSACQKLLNKMLGERTYSAQETAHLLLGIPLVCVSVSFQTLNLGAEGGIREVQTNDDDGVEDLDERRVTGDSWFQRLV
ncbi:hypothetical protein B0H13DRAFT_2663344 [Mycena leptocephala]|nr:hypothetical protein B0H13DRAFT_2663344 [Mycena leptocephala]